MATNTPKPTGGSATMPFTGYGQSGPPPISQAGGPGQQGGQQSGGGGNFPTGSAGPLYSMKTGGYGMFPAEAGKYLPRVLGLLTGANEEAWRSMRMGGGTDRSSQMRMQAGQQMQGMAGQEAERESAAFDQQKMMWGFQNQLMQKLLSLFGGQGGGGGMFADVPMPVQADSRILAGLQERVSREFEPLERQNQQISARTGRYGGQSSWADTRGSNLAARKAGMMSEAYVPAQQATVMGYQPGLEAARIKQQGAITPQLILQALMKGGAFA